MERLLLSPPPPFVKCIFKSNFNAMANSNRELTLTRGQWKRILCIVCGKLVKLLARFDLTTRKHAVKRELRMDPVPGMVKYIGPPDFT